MGCAGSNPLPMGDTVQSAASNGHAVAVEPPLMAAADGGDDKPCSMVQKVIGSVNVDDVVKKIQDVTGSMENLMDDTQEKLGSLFGKVEQKADDIQEKVETKVNDVTSDMPEKPKVNEIILLTVEETRVIPIIPVDEIKSEILTGGNEPLVNEVSKEIKEDLTHDTDEKVTNETKEEVTNETKEEVTNETKEEVTNATGEEQSVEIKADDSTVEESEEQNEGEEEKAKVDEIEEENIEEEKEKSMDKE